jgi:hypothetical protein
MPVTSESDLSTPQARRRANTDARLREALGVLAKDPSTAPTVAGLARAAGVGRNIIYTHHAGVLDALRELQSQREGATETAAGEADRTRSALRLAEARNIALATHNASLLKRAVEAEQRAERSNAATRNSCRNSIGYAGPSRSAPTRKRPIRCLKAVTP